jgi:hypothetical protein
LNNLFHTGEIERHQGGRDYLWRYQAKSLKR